MQSRYDPDSGQHSDPDTWPADGWLADWWRSRSRPGRWLAAGGSSLAVVLTLAGIAGAGGFSSDARGPGASAASPAAASSRVPAAAGVSGSSGSAGAGVTVPASGATGAAAGAAPAGAAPAGAAPAGAAPAGPRPASRASQTACRSVAHIGDSTSVDLISPASLPGASRRLAAQYSDVGVRHLRIDASGGRSVVEEMPGQANGYKVASSLWQHGYRGCWVFALGTNDAADVQAGSAVSLKTRISDMMSAAHGEPVLWVNTRTELATGPWSQASERAWNAQLDRALAKYPNMRIYNWAAAARPSWFLGDGIHYNTAGCAFRAHDIAAALAHAFPAHGHHTRRIVS